MKNSSSSNNGEQLIWHMYMPTCIGLGHPTWHTGMTRVLIWDDRAHASPELVDGMVEYTRMVAESSFGTKLPKCDKYWWKGKDPEVVAQFVEIL